MADLLTVELARFINTVSLETMPAAAVTGIRWRLLEAMAATLSAAPESQDELHDFSSDEHSTAAQKGAQALDEQQILPILSALANGLMLHTHIENVNFGDTFRQIDSAILPAAWAVSEARQRDGKTFMEALAAGYATTATLATLLSNEAEHAWHAGVTSGTVGAAAAAAKARGLSEQATLHALGMAAGQAMQLTDNAAVASRFCESDARQSRAHDPADRPGPGRAAMDGVLCANLAAIGAPSPDELHEQLQAIRMAKLGASPLVMTWFPDVEGAQTLSQVEIEQQFIDRVLPIAGQDKVQALIESVRNMDKVPPGQLMAYVMGRTGRQLHS